MALEADGDITCVLVSSIQTFSQAASGEIIPPWFDDCRRTVEDFAKFVGSNRIVLDLGPSDFERYRQKLLRKGLQNATLRFFAETGSEKNVEMRCEGERLKAHGCDDALGRHLLSERVSGDLLISW